MRALVVINGHEIDLPAQLCDGEIRIRVPVSGTLQGVKILLDPLPSKSGDEWIEELFDYGARIDPRNHA